MNLVGSTMAHGMAISFSAVRIYLRQKSGRMWWDDWLVLGATVMDILYMLTIWVERVNRRHFALFQGDYY